MSGVLYRAGRRAVVGGWRAVGLGAFRFPQASSPRFAGSQPAPPALLYFGQIGHTDEQTGTVAEHRPVYQGGAAPPPRAGPEPRWLRGKRRFGLSRASPGRARPPGSSAFP